MLLLCCCNKIPGYFDKEKRVVQLPVLEADSARPDATHSFGLE